MATTPIIEVRGLAEYRRALRTLGADYRKALDRELKGVARPIADDAKTRYRRLHPSGRRRPRRGTQRGIRAASSARGARVVLGGSRYPYLPGQEWGSNRFPQFPRRKKGGYFFWPAIVEGADDARDRIDDTIDRANRLFTNG